MSVVRLPLPRRCLRAAFFASAAAFPLLAPVFAQDATDAGAFVAQTCAEGEQTCVIAGRVIYLPGFFDQFNPVTALDMVERVPGFSIDEGDDVRGFGGAAGNVLIDAQRPSTKSADIFDTLGRIGAANVDRIELIRGGAGGLDVGGQPVVVNVVRKQGPDSVSPSPWEFTLVKRRPNGGLRPSAEISYLGRAGTVEYTLGASVFGTSLRFNSDETITRFSGPDETRRRDGAFREQGGSANLKLEKSFLNGDTARFSFETQYFKYRESIDETRFAAMGGPDMAFFDFPLENFEYELGADYEHKFTDQFGVKLIALYGREFESFESAFAFAPAPSAPMGPRRSVFLSDETSGETIGRIEFDWGGWTGHAVQFGGEVASNFIDSEAELLAATGADPLAPVMLNGANTRVSEIRGEPFITDSWRAAPDLTVDLGFRFEFSRISQSGDNANSRFFTYPKPSLALTYNVAPKTQLRASVERRVNQLSFDEFVSSVNFDDEDVDFGNPDLQPQRTWAFETAIEQRFGEIGVVELTGFYNYIQDVEDLLPIGGVIEVPGNIGDGTIWGATLDLTMPLDALGLTNARLESSFTARETSVTDPVTGFDRDFSFFEPYFFNVDFRQDLPAHKISWGWGVGGAGDESGFGLDEVSIFSRDTEVDAFIETTALKGVKIHLAVNDIVNVTSRRDRTVFDGSRAFNMPLFREVRDTQNGGGIELTFSGTF
ncbi:TonB-dependent receptor plug domain-containing protein [Hyphococcus sp.]|uniref:TonB-dependent receptor plug domain-containing protein n=1 Tax=Hyphococcus sp. TaxID=2038636 RepID=UPI003CCBA7F2